MNFFMMVLIFLGLLLFCLFVFAFVHAIVKGIFGDEL